MNPLFELTKLFNLKNLREIITVKIILINFLQIYQMLMRMTNILILWI